MEDPAEEKPKKSLYSQKFCFVTFVSRTQRKVDLFWLDFKGSRVLYNTLKYRESFPITTFETHPWLFRDSDTGDVLVANNSDEVYYPVPWTGQHDAQQTVFIDLPVYSLRERAIQILRQHHSEEDMKQFEAPREVKADLLRRENVAHKIYIAL